MTIRESVEILNKNGIYISDQKIRLAVKNNEILASTQKVQPSLDKIGKRNYGSYRAIILNDESFFRWVEINFDKTILYDSFLCTSVIKDGVKKQKKKYRIIYDSKK